MHHATRFSASRSPVLQWVWHLVVACVCTSGPIAAQAQVLKSAERLATPPSAQAVSKASQMQPTADSNRAPVMGPGDQITITVFGQPDMSAEVTVGDSGAITVPLVGTLKVSELTPVQVETLIAQRLKEGGYLQNPGVAVQLKQIRSQMVSVLGEVQHPGRFPLQGRLTVLEALASAGGLTAKADKTVLLLRKPGPENAVADERQEIKIQLDEVSGGQRGQLDATLQNDDVVYVATQKLFFIHGEVRKPGAYPLEVGLNVMKALSISGGVTDRGSMSRIRIHRQDAQHAWHEIDADPAQSIQAEDVIYVNERLF
jgi:polysaccharide export outer membrane protein